MFYIPVLCVAIFWLWPKEDWSSVFSATRIPMVCMWTCKYKCNRTYFVEHNLCDKLDNDSFQNFYCQTMSALKSYKPEVVPSRSPIPSWACLRNFSSLRPGNFAIYCFEFSRRTSWKMIFYFKVKISVRCVCWIYYFINVSVNTSLP